MASKRKSGNDYLKEYNELNAKLNSLHAKTCDRLLELIKIYPNAPIIKCFNVINIKSLKTFDAARYIISIEKYAEEQSGHVQTKIDFN